MCLAGFRPEQVPDPPALLEGSLPLYGDPVVALGSPAPDRGRLAQPGVGESLALGPVQGRVDGSEGGLAARAPREDLLDRGAVCVGDAELAHRQEDQLLEFAQPLTFHDAPSRTARVWDVIVTTYVNVIKTFGSPVKRSTVEGGDTLADMNMESLSRRARSAPALLVGALVTALAAQLSLPLPGSPVPQSLQTLAVVVVGGVLGAGRGGAAMLLYVGMGAAGLPVFADGASGVARLWGPTSGYLAGFVVGSVCAGSWTARPGGRRFRALIAGMAVAHLVILGMGWARLAWLVGPGDALGQGVTPFLWGGAVKSLAAAGILVAWGRWGPGWGPATDEEREAPGPVEPGTPPA